MANLIVITGPRAGETIAIDRELVIGRGEVDIVIEDPKLSRRHASVRPTTDGLEIEDLGSLNGTVVQGARISASAPVVARDGEQIKLGGTTLEVEIEQAADRTVMEPSLDPGHTVLETPPPTEEAPPAAREQTTDSEPAVASPPPRPREPAVAAVAHEPAAVAVAVAHEPPAAAAAPAAPFGAPARHAASPARRSRTADSLLWGPTIVCLLIIIAVAAAEIAYFASRVTPP